MKIHSCFSLKLSILSWMQPQTAFLALWHWNAGSDLAWDVINLSNNVFWWLWPRISFYFWEAKQTNMLCNIIMDWMCSRWLSLSELQLYQPMMGKEHCLFGDLDLEKKWKISDAENMDVFLFIALIKEQSLQWCYSYVHRFNENWYKYLWIYIVMQIRVEWNSSTVMWMTESKLLDSINKSFLNVFCLYGFPLSTILLNDLKPLCVTHMQ